MKIVTKLVSGITVHTLPKIPWQYPVVTEKTAYNSLCEYPGNISANYFAIPWATIIDKNPTEFPLFRDPHDFPQYRAVNFSNRPSGFSLYEKMHSRLNRLWSSAINVLIARKYTESSLSQLLSQSSNGMKTFTVCQHISFRSLCGLMKNIGIDTCFASHAMVDDINYFKTRGIELIPFPLYPVNVSPPNIEKDLLYSFIGMGYRSDYLSDIRFRIFNMKHPPKTIVKRRDAWHFQTRVYKEQVAQVTMSPSEIRKQNDDSREFLDTLSRSRYSLCPSGTGPNSIRFWESLGSGSIPILLSDRMLLPEYDWDSCIIRIAEKDIEHVPGILSTISHDRELEMRRNCLKAFNNFSGDNISSPIRQYFECAK